MSLKQRLLDHCQQYVQQRLDTVTHALEAARQAANEEGKSSVGDKYETGRAMMHLEQEKLTIQLAEAQQLQQVLNSISVEKASPTIAEGSLVLTSQGNYFIAISAGKAELDGRLYYLVSLASPIGAALAGRSTGEMVGFRGADIAIHEVS
ncbi:MAG: 3-oxoacyl-ACP synthase [Saprospiraceae bacterium]|nr:3-oxoacyl-ACP synthase [Saprospiraceae bacterium]